MIESVAVCGIEFKGHLSTVSFCGALTGEPRAYADLYDGNRQASGHGLLRELFVESGLGRAAVLQHA